MTDVYNSISVLVAFVAIQMGWLWADMAVAIVIVGLILWAGYQIIESNSASLVDRVAIEPSVIEAVVLSVDGVCSCHKIRSRGMSSHVFIDLHIQVDPELTVAQAHKIAYAVEDKLKQIEAYTVADVLVHVEEAIVQPA